MIEKIERDNPLFPTKLKDSVANIKEIYVKGNVALLETTSIAVVGSRKCTPYGKTVAQSIGKRIGENNVTLVSGLARGIDTFGHMGSLEAKGNTIAVLACGIDCYYPAENRQLQDKIGQDGLLISEYPPGTKPRPDTFPSRNRIISGISDSVVIVEAGNRSGALITAECAAEHGKLLYAVPGNITSQTSFGTNKLIRESVTPLIIIDDLFIDLGINPCILHHTYEKMGEQEKEVFDFIKNCGEVTIDQIYHKTNIKPAIISGIITILEMKGLVFSSLGKVFVAKF